MIQNLRYLNTEILKNLKLKILYKVYLILWIKGREFDTETSMGIRILETLWTVNKVCRWCTFYRAGVARFRVMLHRALLSKLPDYIPLPLLLSGRTSTRPVSEKEPARPARQKVQRPSWVTITDISAICHRAHSLKNRVTEPERTAQSAPRDEEQDSLALIVLHM